ncbi:hypothetical protein [Paenibacillus sanguinis]|uniref:hypothetical protein n=1 Tax=Paenibacillus sanguinis TaxID=225906 RepID=UPI00035F6274|nr:hypothetical protein [Paenibacillus sanguinis]
MLVVAAPAEELSCEIKSLHDEISNEVIASKIMERLGIPHVPYTLMEQEDYPYSVCENFITPQTELITAWYVMHTRQKPNQLSVYQHYVNCCEALGITGIVEALDQMIVVHHSGFPSRLV